MISGASDDLIEIDGAVCDETEGGEKTTFSASDGTKGTISYNGNWEIDVTEKGSKYLEQVPAVGDDNIHEEPYHRYPSYSDILVLDDGIEWVKVGRKTFKATA